MSHSKRLSAKFCHSFSVGSISCPSLSAVAQASKLTKSSPSLILAASRLNQPVNEAPAAVTLIDRQMIQDSGVWGLSEMFRLESGMQLACYFACVYSTDRIVSHRRLLTETNSHPMQVPVDGRSVYPPLHGGTIWSDIPVELDDIERIKVIRANADYFEFRHDNQAPDRTTLLNLKLDL